MRDGPQSKTDAARQLFNVVKAAHIEGRLENVLDRQKQLANLFDAVQLYSEDIIAAITQDLQTTEQDAKRELHLALSSIKHVYESLDWKQSLQLEQASKAQKTTNTLQPLGMVFLTSLRHCPFVSILAPLAATVGAGAATIALPKEGFENVNRILRRLVRENLDVEAVGIGEGLFFDAFLNMEFDVAVLQDAKTFGNACAQLTKSNPFIRIVRPSFGSPAIFIDRTVEDIEGAASCIVHALRWASKNGNPLVPRLCFVDEYVIEELKCAIQKRANLEGGGSARKEPAKSHAKGDGVSPRETESGELVSLLYTGLDIPILFSSTQDSALSEIKDLIASDNEKSASFLLLGTKSLDEGMDIFNKINGSNVSRATYIFASGKEAFYLAKFTNAQCAFVNQMPLESFMASESFNSTMPLQPHFGIEDFSFSKSIFHPAHGKGLSSHDQSSRTLDKDRVRQVKGGRVSYFEQGLVVGAAIALLTTTCGVYLMLQARTVFWD